MSSKIEPHYEFVMKEVARGQNLMDIANTLTAMGCTTSRQNLSTWLSRRKSRIEQRLANSTPVLPLPPIPPTQTLESLRAPIVPLKPPISNEELLDQLIERVSKEGQFGRLYLK